MSILQHEKVAEHYNRIRYPRYPWVFWGSWRDLERIHVQTWGATKKIEKAWLCGAGTIQPLLFGRRNPDVRFLATDLSTRSLREAHIRCLLHGVLNIEFRHEDVFNSKAHEEFDAIDAYGVLHHTVDPARALAILARALKPGGVVRLMLYSTEARKYLEEIRSTLLGRKADWNDAEVLQILKERQVPLVGDLSSKAGRIDALLHPQVITFNNEEIQNLINGSGLRTLRQDSSGNHLIFLQK